MSKARILIVDDEKNIRLTIAQLGELQEIEGDRVEALKNYRVATDLDPTYKPAQNNLTRATRSHKSRPPLIF
ncbi:hypothetical protein [Allocoleopsis franciscana]|uniref:hypothetical protein n=1 Tax=Allocoleopsis franciscana TaxID=2886352 RepID=UPI0002EF9CBB|nr:hypothetical protein [Allocoleopsis franciscana]